MTDKRRIKVPFYPYLFLLFAIAFVVFAAVYYLNFPSQLSLVYSVLGVSLLFAIVAFVARPSILKEIFANRKTALWINDIILVLIILAIGVLLSHIGFRRNFRYDFTRNKIFSLSELTVKTVRELDRDVKIWAFFPKGSNEEGIMIDLFKEYKRHSDKLSWVMIDPQIDPVTSQKMNISVMGTVVIESGANKRTVLPSDLFFVPNRQVAPNDTPKFTGEQALTSAIVDCIKNEKKVVTVVTGHEEASISGFRTADLAALNQLLTQENYEVVENSLITDEIDPRTNLLLIVSPKKDFLESEIAKLREYVTTKKGNILFAFDPNPNLKNLNDFVFKEYSVAPNYDIVVDPRGVSQNYWTVAPELMPHEITNPVIKKKLIGLMFHCCSLLKENSPDVKHKVLMKSITNSWAKRGLESQKQIGVHYDKSLDALGPLDLAVIAEKTNTASGSKALIIGDSDIIGNTYIAIGGNRDLVINSINWLAGNENMISIRPRVLEIPRIQFDTRDSTKIFSLCVFGAPVFIMFFGLIVYLYRRRVR